MNKSELIKVLKDSLPDRVILHYASVGAVKIGEELIVLKTRYWRNSFAESLEEFYDTTFTENDYPESVIGKNVIIDNSLINHRGKIAIGKYIASK